MAVETPAVGSYEVGSEAVAGTTTYNTPTVTVTSQGSTVTTGGLDLTVTWTYSQADGKVQERYRVIVDNGSSTVYYDWLHCLGSDKPHVRRCGRRRAGRHYRLCSAGHCPGDCPGRRTVRI